MQDAVAAAARVTPFAWARSIQQILFARFQKCAWGQRRVLRWMHAAQIHHHHRQHFVFFFLHPAVRTFHQHIGICLSNIPRVYWTAICKDFFNVGVELCGHVKDILLLSYKYNFSMPLYMFVLHATTTFLACVLVVFNIFRTFFIEV